MPEPIAQHGIKIAGENPMIVLYRPGSDDIVVLASMWTARYSPVGSGRALLIWADPGESGLGSERANRDLHRQPGAGRVRLGALLSRLRHDPWTRH